MIQCLNQFEQKLNIINTWRPDAQQDAQQLETEMKENNKILPC